VDDGSISSLEPIVTEYNDERIVLTENIDITIRIGEFEDILLSFIE